VLVYLQMIDNPKDRAKFEQIYLSYKSLMFHVANEILHNEQDAEDAVHNAFLTIARNIHKLEQARSPQTRSYVSIVCESRAIDLLRERRKLQAEELSELHTFMGASADLLENKPHDLEWCIQHLPPLDREYILLKYQHGYSVQEIADLLEISFDAAKKRGQRARERLDALCRKEGIL